MREPWDSHMTPREITKNVSRHFAETTEKKLSNWFVKAKKMGSDSNLCSWRRQACAKTVCVSSSLPFFRQCIFLSSDTRGLRRVSGLKGEHERQRRRVDVTVAVYNEQSVRHKHSSRARAHLHASTANIIGQSSAKFNSTESLNEIYLATGNKYSNSLFTHTDWTWNGGKGSPLIHLHMDDWALSLLIFRFYYSVFQLEEGASESLLKTDDSLILLMSVLNSISLRTWNESS